MDDNVPNLAEFLARYVHPQKLLPPLPGVRAGLEAQVFGLSTSGYDALLAPIAARTKRAATRLLEYPESARILERLGQRPTTLVGLGDSLTDDANSWLEILRAANDQIGGQLKIVNAGVSGETTVQMLAHMPEVMSREPDIVVCLGGTNDVRRFDPLREPQMSAGASREALLKLRSFAARRSACAWLWVTPAGIDAAAAATHWFWKALDVTWDAADLAALAAAVSEFPDPVLDLFRHFRGPGLGEFVSADGVHPEPETHLVIARHVLGAVEPLLAARQARLSGRANVDDHLISAAG